MAQYHCHVATVSRSPTPSAPKGRSAVACAAYRSGDQLHDEHSTRVEARPIVHDYTRRGGVVHAEIVLPPGAPAWARDRQTLWNNAEAADVRKNSTLAREFECSLPYELHRSQRVELARAITAELVARYGFAADFALHAPHRNDDQRNHHVHILCSTRVLVPEGFAEKTRVLDAVKTGPGEVSWAREMVARLCNEALASAGVDAAVDHRSLVDQRIAALAAGDDERAAALDRPPTKHRGPSVSGLVERGDDSDVDERHREEIANELDAIGARQLAEAELQAAAEQVAEILLQLAEASKEASAAGAELDALNGTYETAEVTEYNLPSKEELGLTPSLQWRDVLSPPNPVDVELAANFESLLASAEAREREADGYTASPTPVGDVAGESNALTSAAVGAVDSPAPLHLSVTAVQALAEDFLGRYEGPKIGVVVIDSEGSADILAAEFAGNNTLILAADLLHSSADVVEEMDRTIRAKFHLPAEEDELAKVARKREATAEADEAPASPLGGEFPAIPVAKQRNEAPAPSLGAKPIDETRRNAVRSQVPAAVEAAQPQAGEQLRQRTEARRKQAEEERLQTALILETEATVAEFQAGYTGSVQVRIIVVVDPEAVVVAEFQGETMFVAAGLASQIEVRNAIEAAIRRRHGLSVLRPGDRASILRAVVTAASSGLADAWGMITDRYPAMPLAQRAERVFAYAANAVETAGKTWDAICVRLATALRQVGLLRGTNKLPEMRQIAHELSENMRVEAASAATEGVGNQAPTVTHQAPKTRSDSWVPAYQMETSIDLRAVVALVSRLDVALAGDPRRQEWQTLALLDSMPRHFDKPQIEHLRQLLSEDPRQLALVDAELRRRVAELKRYEQQAELDWDENQAPR